MPSTTASAWTCTCFRGGRTRVCAPSWRCSRWWLGCSFRASTLSSASLAASLAASSASSTRPSWSCIPATGRWRRSGGSTTCRRTFCWLSVSLASCGVPPARSMARFSRYELCR
ncbi:amino acid permease, putative [Leishmania tarentolae]|uniref:Amino acid permease, putative n=1 Tax=Leishmania tarentolae TaxID=5689 RepID=A0A640KPN4_LEITA|nr:amino acid permease, putative [Leishmania tarentolae]